MRASSRVRCAIGLVCIAVAAGAACWFARDDRASPDPTSLSAHPSIERDGLRYEYDALTGEEALFDLGAPSGLQVNVLTERPEAARSMRTELERKLNIGSVERLREAHRAEADELRRLGYL